MITTTQYNESELKHDYVCPEHQCLASDCGCLTEHLRNHCPVHGVERKRGGDGNLYCPYCDFPLESGWGD